MFTETNDLKFLTNDELEKIDAGRNIIFWFGYAIGYVGYEYYESSLEMTRGSGTCTRR